MSCYSILDLLFNNKEEISEITENVKTRSYVGYSSADCVSIELQCIDLDGEYQFGLNQSEVRCVCDW